MKSLKNRLTSIIDEIAFQAIYKKNNTIINSDYKLYPQTEYEQAESPTAVTLDEIRRIFRPYFYSNDMDGKLDIVEDLLNELYSKGLENGYEYGFYDRDKAEELK